MNTSYSVRAKPEGVSSEVAPPSSTALAAAQARIPSSGGPNDRLERYRARGRFEHRPPIPKTGGQEVNVT